MKKIYDERNDKISTLEIAHTELQQHFTKVQMKLRDAEEQNKEMDEMIRNLKLVKEKLDG